MVEPFVSAAQRPPVQYTTVSERTPSESVVTSSFSAQAPPQSTNSRSFRPDKSQLGVTNSSTSQIAGLSVISPVQGGASSVYTPSEVSRPRIQQSHPSLTDDQADFVNSLYANNVPAGAIARVIERMMAGERHPVVDGYDSLPPPSYYHGTTDG